MAKIGRTSDWNVEVRVWIERRGEAVLGEGRAELLAAIDRERSITRAAKAVGMSYRRAWNLVQEVNAAAGETLVAAAVGGRSGGGARLTPRGRLATAVYEQVRQSLVDSAAGLLQRTVNADADTLACIHVAAAISLQEAVGQILAEYALRAPTVHVRTIFGASNELADHVLAGAPGDLFLSADPSEMDRLQSARLIIAGSRRGVARNGLAIVGVKQTSAMKTVADLMSKRFKRVALAEPACPLGQHSKAYLTKIRLYDDLLPKVLHVDNSRAVLAAVVTGAAEAGVAFSSDADSGGAWQTLLRVPTSQAAAMYEAAVIGRGAPRQETTALCDFLSSSTAQRCFRRCGLRPAVA